MKTLFDILNKHNIKGLNVQVVVQKNNIQQNNLSRHKFKTFLSSVVGAKQIGVTNGFIINGKKYGYSLPKSYTPECRQFAQDYDGLVCEFPDGKVKWFDKDVLNIGNVSRIGPDGVQYFNVKGFKHG